jgi:para-nitrobenzyl esterase
MFEFVFHHDWGYTGEDCMRINIPIWYADGEKAVMFWSMAVVYCRFFAGLPSYDGESLPKKAMW